MQTVGGSGFSDSGGERAFGAGKIHPAWAPVNLTPLVSAAACAQARQILTELRDTFEQLLRTLRVVFGSPRCNYFITAFNATCAGNAGLPSTYNKLVNKAAHD